MISQNRCLVCGSGNTAHYLQTCDFFLTREKFSLSRCADCGFVFTSAHPGEEEMGKYYASESYLSHSDSPENFSARLYRVTRNFMVRKKRKLAEKAAGTRKGRLLDIGSGSGYFAGEMKRSGWNVTGIEINDGARELSAARFNIEVFPPDRVKALPDSEFGCITLWHVLEHFQDPVSYCAEIHRVLKPAGTCIIALPNCSSFDAEHYREHWAAYDVPRHLWHFSPGTFRRFAGMTGFRVSGVKSLPLDVFYISSLSEKYKGTKLHFIKGILRGTWFSFLSIFNKEKSSSLVFILRKD